MTNPGRADEVQALIAELRRVNFHHVPTGTSGLTMMKAATALRAYAGLLDRQEARCAPLVEACLHYESHCICGGVGEVEFEDAFGLYQCVECSTCKPARDALRAFRAGGEA